MYEPIEILKKYWGYPNFRSFQESIIQSVLKGDDTIALLPTGGGKSLCYQLPAMCMEGTCLVISPLIALMKDQVDQLKKIGINAHAIYTGLTKREIDIILDNCIYGNVKLLYVSPERLQTEIFIERVKKMKINLFAIDEAHCISQWGYDFRPSYLQIADFKKQFIPDTNTIALTASATPQVVEDISQKLELKDPVRFKASFTREKLSYSIRKVENKDKKLLEILKNVPGSSIIYLRSRKGTKDLNLFLLQHKISSDYYHAGLNNELRHKKQDLWQKGLVRVMVATNAFGMGINKPDVRSVIHYDIPDSLEAYYQEAGRAGRDGKKAYAVVLHHKSDNETLRANFERSYPSIDFMKMIYQALANYYKIAVGSNQLSFYDFDLDDFCKSFGFNGSEAYNAIKKLEEEGFIELNESFFHPSKISFNVDKAKLYEFQIANVTFDPIIKTLLRLYGGELFDNFLKISEGQIAKFLNITTFKVKSSLEHLHDRQILTYDKIKDRPQLAFLTHRYDANKLPLHKNELESRKQIKKEKMEAMIGYVIAESKCRNRLILDYFGETNYENCGNCDFCIEQRKSVNKSDKERIREIIAYHLKKGPELPEVISDSFDPGEREMAEYILKEMAEYDELGYDKLGRLYLK